MVEPNGNCKLCTGSFVGIQSLQRLHFETSWRLRWVGNWSNPKSLFIFFSKAFPLGGHVLVFNCESNFAWMKLCWSARVLRRSQVAKQATHNWKCAQGMKTEHLSHDARLGRPNRHRVQRARVATHKRFNMAHQCLKTSANATWRTRSVCPTHNKYQEHERVV